MRVFWIETPAQIEALEKALKKYEEELTRYPVEVLVEEGVSIPGYPPSIEMQAVSQLRANLEALKADIDLRKKRGW